MKILVLDYKAMSTAIVKDLRMLGHEVDYSTNYKMAKENEMPIKNAGS